MKWIIAMCLVIGIAAHAKDEQQLPTPEAVSDSYKKTYVRMTKEPHVVSMQIATLCTYPPPQAMIDAEKKRVGPHANAWIHVFVNASAEGALKAKKKSYPVGSVVVKEKTGSGDVGGMIKREKGYDAKAGDWQFFYRAKGEKASKGQIASCVDCHAGAKKTDYVFGSWLERE